MGFSEEQNAALKAKIKREHIRTRTTQAGALAYLEGWHVIAEANRIFGFDCWDRQTLAPVCVWSDKRAGETWCCYSTKVRITVRAAGSVVVREGIGTGTGHSLAVDQAHEIALKAAETDATKRALATFGNPFGLSLYNKGAARLPKRAASKRELLALPKPVENVSKSEVAAADRSDFVMRPFVGDPQMFSSAEEFVSAMLRELPKLGCVEEVYQFWEENLDGLRRLRYAGEPQKERVESLVDALKGRARALARREPVEDRDVDATGQAKTVEPLGLEPSSALLRPKEVRRRDKEHLAFVARQPCLVCGRKPSHAHHLRFAQSRAMGLKVSDEFAVPLCAVHHDALHRVGDERAWWARHGILDPLEIARRLWTTSRGPSAAPVPDGRNGAGDVSASHSPGRRNGEAGTGVPTAAGE